MSEIVKPTIKDDNAINRFSAHVLKMRYLSNSLDGIIGLMNTETRAGFAVMPKNLRHEDKRSIIQNSLANQCFCIEIGDSLDSMWTKCQTPLISLFGWKKRRAAKKTNL